MNDHNDEAEKSASFTMNSYASGAKPVYFGPVNQAQKMKISQQPAYSGQRSAQDSEEDEVSNNLEEDCIFGKKKKFVNIPLESRNVSQDSHAIALILNIYKYAPIKTKIMDRTGSQDNVNELIDMFTDYNVDIWVPHTKTVMVSYAHIRDWVEQFKVQCAVQIEEKRVDACFIVIMGHGDEQGVFCDSDHKPCSIEKEIFPLLNNANFVAGIDIPKIFFMNCCRGSVPTTPVSVDQPGGSPELKNLIPPVKDFLIFWSTTPENYSLRDSEGSKFIRFLCQEFKLHRTNQDATSVEITYIFKKIAAKMAAEIRSESLGLTQIPNIDDRAFGNFYWTPKSCDYKQIQVSPRPLDGLGNEVKTLKTEKSVQRSFSPWLAILVICFAIFLMFQDELKNLLAELASRAKLV